MALPRHPAARASTLRAPKVRVVRFSDQPSWEPSFWGGDMIVFLKGRNAMASALLKKEKERAHRPDSIYLAASIEALWEAPPQRRACLVATRTNSGTRGGDEKLHFVHTASFPECTE